MRFRDVLTTASTLSVTAAMVVALPSPSYASEYDVLIGASDIATCSSSGDEATAAILEQQSGTIFTAGDNSQTNGTDYSCYDVSWGSQGDGIDPLADLKSRTRPTPGNHDYLLSNNRTGDGAGYYEYFGEAAGEAGEGYYSYNLGDNWHVVALNSNCTVVGCGTDSDQWAWLQQDLEDNQDRTCTVAYWHHPVFTSAAKHPANEKDVSALFQLLYASGAELVMTGHNHVYERSGPIAYDATTQTYVKDDSGNGIRTFTVGTGGASHDSFKDDAEIDTELSEARIADMYGVLKLTLQDAGYSWEFIPVTGTSDESGTGVCH